MKNCMIPAAVGLLLTIFSLLLVVPYEFRLEGLVHTIINMDEHQSFELGGPSVLIAGSRPESNDAHGDDICLSIASIEISERGFPTTALRNESSEGMSCAGQPAYSMSEVQLFGFLIDWVFSTMLAWIAIILLSDKKTSNKSS